MMKCKGREHNFGEHERKQYEGEKCRKRPAEDENEDEVQEFFGVVDRIHAMQKLFKQKLMSCPSAGKIPTYQNDGGSFINLKSSWKPSLEWEDFSALARKSSSFSYRSNTNAVTWVVAESPCIGSDQNMGVGRFDLNVEATAEE
ncbi:hypothetical protein SUGI_0029420 [Cryptomeria japonica]|uniref:uncharacterized protein LOC131074621 n=1 Tax=Cryptomeria japonica TaxID=3369 RepID=UPI002408ACDF|nr:uncharacterized protein LOC131074621 [Cryptomeria japonica]GLJ05968.1 hypothetical protein SUGI_0029420 [Cryptomeria japonica]